MNMDDPTRRDMLVAGTAPTALATTPALFAQQAGQAGVGARFYEKGSVLSPGRRPAPAFR